MTENNSGLNPYPLELLTEEQEQIYKKWEELFKISNTPLPEGLAVGTVIMPTGDLMVRAAPTLDAYKNFASKQETPPHLVVTGKWSSPGVAQGGATSEKVVRAMQIYGKIPKDLKENIIAEMDSGNTKEQAVNCLELQKEGKIKDPWVIVVTHFHLPRLMGCFIKQILKTEDTIKTRIYTIPVDLPWNKAVPLVRRGEMGPPAWERVFSEMKRIHTYREKGDVATQEEMVKYSNWLRSQK